MLMKCSVYIYWLTFPHTGCLGCYAIQITLPFHMFQRLFAHDAIVEWMNERMNEWVYQRSYTKDCITWLNDVRYGLHSVMGEIMFSLCRHRGVQWALFCHDLTVANHLPACMAHACYLYSRRIVYKRLPKHGVSLAYGRCHHLYTSAITYIH